MSKIVIFKEGGGRKCPIRFVKDFRAGGWFRRERVSYTIINIESYSFSDGEEVPDFVKERILKDWPGADISVLTIEEFYEKYAKQEFWAIARYTGDAEDYYCGLDKDKRAAYTSDIQDAFIMLSDISAEETLTTIQMTTRDKVFVRPLYLNLINELLTPTLMITCTNKNSGKTRYFKKLEGKRVRMVDTSNAATKFTYNNAINFFTYLHRITKNFSFAVLPAFKDNVAAHNIEDYMREEKITRSIAMALKLKHFNK